MIDWRKSRLCPSCALASLGLELEKLPHRAEVVADVQ